MKIRFAAATTVAWAACSLMAGPLMHLAGGRPTRDDYVRAWGVRVSDFGRQFATDGALEVDAIDSNVPCNIAYPGDEAEVSVQVRNVSRERVKCRVRWIRIDDTLETRSDDVFDVNVVKLAEASVGEAEIDLAPGRVGVFKVAPKLPAAFGASALLMERVDTGTRLLATHLARIVDPETPQGAHSYRICMDLADGPAIARLKTAPNRIGVPVMFSCDKRRDEEVSKIERRLSEIKATGYPVCIEFGAGEGNSPAQPLGRPRPHLADDGTLLETKSDMAWLPSYDEEFKAYVKHFVRKFGYPHGPVNGVMLWNEPWNGISISGWGADELRYREMYAKMSEAVEEARAEDPELNVLIGGCDSSSNTFDMLFCDDDMSFLDRLDFMSEHYQGLSPSLPKFLLDRKSPRGRTRIWDTETWVANSPDRIPGVLAGMFAAGYDRMVGIQGEAVVATGYETRVYDDAGKEKERRRVFRAWPAAPALAAFQKFVGNRAFEKILFAGYPWIYIFRGEQKGDITVTVCGDIGPAFDGKGRSGSVPFWTSRGGDVLKGTMKLSGVAGVSVYDGNGNLVDSGRDGLTLPLSDRSFYLRGDGSEAAAERLVRALAEAEVSGLPRVSPSFADAVRPIGAGAEFRAMLRNVSNREVCGTLEVKAEGLLLDYEKKVTVKPGETASVGLKVKGGEASRSNAYPFSLVFTESDGCVTRWSETLHCNVIADLTGRSEKSLDGALPQPIVAGGSGATMMERAWLPMLDLSSTGKPASGTADVRLGADDEFFYFSARIADSTPDEGMIRYAERNDDEFFYPEESFERDMDKCLAMTLGRTQVPMEGGQTVWSTNVRFAEFTYEVPAGGARLAMLLADDDEMVRREYDFYVMSPDGAERHFILFPMIDRCWVRFNVPAGTSRVRFGMRPWKNWLKPQVSAIAVDPPEAGLDREAVERDVGSGFSLEYGKTALFRPGDKGLVWSSATVGRTLKWPEGVRRYSYRKGMDLPQGGVYAHDNVQIAFNVLPDSEKRWYPSLPGAFKGYVSYWDSDYGFDLNPVAERYGGGTEIWRERTPYLPDKHFFPRQPKHPREGAVVGGRLEITRDAAWRYVKAAIPWAEMPEVKAARDAGRPVKFSCRVNDNAARGMCMELAYGRSVSKRNESFKPAWFEHWANEVEFGWERK